MLLPFIAGCFKVGPDYVKPEMPVAAAFVGEGAVQQVAATQGSIVESWWRNFNDPKLRS
jgi:outer membrane protein TolC